MTGLTYCMCNMERQFSSTGEQEPVCYKAEMQLLPLLPCPLSNKGKKNLKNIYFQVVVFFKLICDYRLQVIFLVSEAVLKPLLCIMITTRSLGPKIQYLGVQYVLVHKRQIRQQGGKQIRPKNLMNAPLHYLDMQMYSF